MSIEISGGVSLAPYSGAISAAADVTARVGSAYQVEIGYQDTAAQPGITFGLAGDTNLYRSVANALKTDDKLIVGTDLDINGVDGNSDSLKLNGAGSIRWGQAAHFQTTVGAAGGASALPATPTKYVKIKDNAGTTFVIPVYAAS